MADDTIRTRTLEYARANWKMVIAWGISAFSSVAAVSMAFGHKQANGEQLVADVASLKSDMKDVKASAASTNVALATIQGTLNGINMKTDAFDKFKGDVQKGAQEALATPVPKGPQPGHRARPK